MAVSRLVEGRSDDLGIDAGRHVGDFLRTLVDEEDDHIDLGVVGCDSVSDILQQDGLTRLGLCDDETTLPLTDRCEEVDDTHSDLVLHTRIVGRLEAELLIGEDRREVVEGDTVTHLRGGTPIDTCDAIEGEVLIAILWRTDEALDEVTWAQAPLLDLIGREVDIVRRREVVVVR